MPLLIGGGARAPAAAWFEMLRRRVVVEAKFEGAATILVQKRHRSTGHISKPPVTFRTEGDEIAWIGSRSSSMATFDPPDDLPKVALLVDGDNVGAKYFGPLIADLSAYGRVTVRKVFCNWTDTAMRKGWKEALVKYAAEGVHHANLVPGKTLQTRA